MSKLEDLDPKRRRFEEYAVDWNATQAAIRAGRTEGSMRVGRGS
jgi:phage terminase small subunit